LRGLGPDGWVRQAGKLLDLPRRLQRGVFSGAGAKGMEAFDGEDGFCEDHAKLACGLMRYSFERGQARGIRYFQVEAGDGLVGDAARVNEQEVTEVGGEVEGEAMRGDAARDMDADGGDFPVRA